MAILKLEQLYTAQVDIVFANQFPLSIWTISFSLSHFLRSLLNPMETSVHESAFLSLERIEQEGNVSWEWIEVLISNNFVKYWVIL